MTPVLYVSQIESMNSLLQWYQARVRKIGSQISTCQEISQNNCRTYKAQSVASFPIQCIKWKDPDISRKLWTALDNGKKYIYLDWSFWSSQLWLSLNPYESDVKRSNRAVQSKRAFASPQCIRVFIIILLCTFRVIGKNDMIVYSLFCCWIKYSNRIHAHPIVLCC